VTRYLVVNADDFGWSTAVNAGVIACHGDGVVTSASLMVRGAAVAEAIALARDRPALGLGLHVDLGEWVHVAGRGWEARDVVVDTDDPAAVDHEVRRQLASFVELVGGPPTHLDGHQHVQRHEPAGAILCRLAAELAVPLRDRDDRVAYRGDFYGQGPRGEPYPDGVTARQLIAVVSSLSGGWSEIGCHPGIGVDPATTGYACERDAEVAALCDPAVRAAIDAAGVTLATFRDL
jgi:chitin disaccharide deacetylase